MGRHLLTLIIALFTFCLIGQEAELKSEEGFLKKIHFVVGGCLGLSNGTNPHIANFTNNAINLNSTSFDSYIVYQTESSSFNPQIYLGIKLGKRFLFAVQYEYGKSYNQRNLIYRTQTSPSSTLKRQTLLNKRGLFARYSVPISTRFQFGLQGDLSRSEIISDHTNINFGSNDQRRTEENDVFNFDEFALSANLTFSFNKSFNVIVQFGEFSFKKGNYKKTTRKYLNGILDGELVFKDDPLNVFDLNLDGASVLLGLEIIL